jgi:hypothetical protein
VQIEKYLQPTDLHSVCIHTPESLTTKTHAGISQLIVLHLDRKYIPVWLDLFCQVFRTLNF